MCFRCALWTHLFICNSLFSLFSPPAQPPGLLAAQAQWRDGPLHLLHVPHRPLPVHVLDVRPSLQHPSLQRALPPAAVCQPGQLVHLGAAGLLVRSAVPKGLPSLPAQPQPGLVSHGRHRRCHWQFKRWLIRGPRPLALATHSATNAQPNHRTVVHQDCLLSFHNSRAFSAHFNQLLCLRGPLHLQSNSTTEV